MPPVQHSATSLVRDRPIFVIYLEPPVVESDGEPHTDEVYPLDDSHLNCKYAQARGWTVVHLVEPGLPIPRIPASRYLISNLEELRIHFPNLFKT